MDFSYELQMIREHLDTIEAELKQARMMSAYNGNYSEYNNADTNGNYSVEDWNDKIKEDR